MHIAQEMDNIITAPLVTFEFKQFGFERNSMLFAKPLKLLVINLKFPKYEAEKNQIEIYFKIVQNVFIVKVVNFLGMSSHTVSDVVNVVALFV